MAGEYSIRSQSLKCNRERLFDCSPAHRLFRCEFPEKCALRGESPCDRAAPDRRLQQLEMQMKMYAEDGPVPRAFRIALTTRRHFFSSPYVRTARIRASSSLVSRNSAALIPTLGFIRISIGASKRKEKPRSA